MRTSRRVAYDAADDETLTEPLETRAKVPVWQSLGAGWIFLFRNFPAVFARVWLAGIVLAVLDARLSVKIDPDTASAAAMNAAGWMSIAYVALYLLVAASLYSLALGVKQKPILAGFAVGPDELRYLMALLIFAVIVIVLLLGALLVGQQIAKLVAYSGGIAELSTKASLSDVQWFKDMSSLEIALRFGPLGIAALIVLWFGLRYTFVPLHVISTQKFALFDGLALTKNNTWRLFGLTLLLFIVLEIVAIAIVIGVEGIAGAQFTTSGGGLRHAVRTFGEAAAAAGSFHGQHVSIGSPRSLPEWLSSALSTALNMMALAVMSGTFAHAYKRVTGET